MITKILLSSAGVGFLLFLAGKFLPEKQYRDICRGFGRKISKGARGKLGFIWEKIETFLQFWIGIAWEEISIGLDEDDKNEEANSETPKKD